MKKINYILAELLIAISCTLYCSTPVFAQLLKYNSETEIFGAAAVSPESGRQLLQKLVNYCSSISPENEAPGKKQLEAWIYRHQKYLDENVIVRKEYLAMVKDSNAEAKVKEGVVTMFNVSIPKMIDSQFEALVSPMKSAPDIKSKNSLCNDYFQSIGDGKFDLKNNDPVVLDFLNKKIAQEAKVTNEVGTFLSLNKQAVTAYFQRKYQIAVKYGKDAAQIAEQDSSVPPNPKSSNLFILAKSYKELAMYPQAVAAMDRAVAIAETSMPSDKGILVDYLANFAEILMLNHEDEKAVQVAKRALEIADAGPTKPILDLITALNVLGNIYLNESKIELARPALGRAMTIIDSYKSMFGSGTFTKNTLLATARLYRIDGRAVEADELEKRANSMKDVGITAVTNVQHSAIPSSK